MTRRIDRSILFESFQSGFHERPSRRLGLEYELIGVTEEDARAVQYNGSERSVSAVLTQLSKRFDWRPAAHTKDGERILELERDGSRITLEPGGQLELSARPHEKLADVREELARHIDELRDCSESLGILWLPLGLQPISHPDEISVLPKERYRIMTEYLPTRGDHAFWMMRASAGMQINLDVFTPAEAASKLRLALLVCPLITAIFANSPLTLGETNGFRTRRGWIWNDVDPDRCGIPRPAIARDVTTAGYFEWAMNAGMFFVERDGGLVDMTGHAFGEFVDRGANGLVATKEDWELHLTTLFPEARLKTYLELRCADSNNIELALAYVALAIGLFYGDDETLQSLEEFVASPPFERIGELHDVCTREGLGGTAPDGTPIEQLVRRLVTIAAGTLDNCCPYERAFLAPIERIVESGETPADRLLGQWDGAFGRSATALARAVVG